MEIVYLLLPASVLLALVALVGYLWASKTGQYDDLDTPPLRMLHDDDEVEKHQVAKRDNPPDQK